MKRGIVGLLAVGAAMAVATACATLEPVATGVCGNGVLDRDEDCDEAEGSTAASKGKCLRAGELNACHYTCDTSASCPPAWGCDLNEGICRRSGGTFSRKLRIETGAVRLAKGDFDGDGRADLLLSQASGLDGASAVTGYFFGEGMRERERRRIPNRMGPPYVFPSALSDKALGVEAEIRLFPLSDVGFVSTVGVGVLRGNEEEPFLPELLPFKRLTTSSRIIPIPSAPDATGSLRGRVTYAAAIKQPSGKSSLLSVSLDSVGTPTAIIYGVEIDGDPAALASLTAPAGRSLCLSTRSSGATPPTESCSNALVYFQGTQKSALYILDAESKEPPRRRPRVVTTGVIDSVATGDIDGDGRTDILIGQPRVGGPACPVVLTGAALAAAVPPPNGDFVLTPTLLTLPDCSQRFLGAADLNGDHIADLVFGTQVFFSTKAADAGATPEWRLAYQSSATEWTQLEVGDFDGDGRDDAVLASVGQSELTVLRGGLGEVRPTTVPTPEPVDFLTSGFFDADRALDVAYSTKSDTSRARPGKGAPTDAGAPTSASIYVVFGGSTPETLRVGKRAGATLSNLRRPVADATFPDIDLLGIEERSEAGSALYALYSPEGRGFVSLIGKESRVGGRCVALSDLYGTGHLDAVRLKLPDTNPCDNSGDVVTVAIDPDLLQVGVGGDVTDMEQHVGPHYRPLGPLAVLAARVGAKPMVFTVGVLSGFLSLRWGEAGASTEVGAKLSLRDLIPPVAYEADLCGDRQKDRLTPTEKFQLLDVDGDGNDDLVFSDGGRVRLKGDAVSPYDLWPGVVLVLRSDGAGGFARVSAEGMRGRSFAKAKLPDGRPALAVLEPGNIAFYTLSSGALARVAGADVSLEDVNGQALEVGDFDGDGVDDLAVLGGGVLKIYAGEPPTTKDGG